MKIRVSIILFTFLIASCNQPGCKNSNAILNQNEANSWAYQNELMRLIEENPNEVAYYFDRRLDMGGDSYIVMNCYGQDFCGELKTRQVTKNLESFKLQNNKGYSGAKLEGVVLKKVKLEDGHEVFALEKLEKIVD